MTLESGVEVVESELIEFNEVQLAINFQRNGIDYGFRVAKSKNEEENTALRSKLRRCVDSTICGLEYRERYDAKEQVPQ